MRKSINGTLLQNCGRTKANEKFSGKGHKNHVFKDCAGKARRKAKKIKINENTYNTEIPVFLNDKSIHMESINSDDDWFSEIEFEKQNIDDGNDEELPF
jgi:hypothetical protein